MKMAQTSIWVSTLATIFLLTSISTQSHAHRAWMLPSATVLSGENAWVTVDGAISNSLFYFEHHALNLDNLRIVSPTGKSVEAQNKATAKYRSIFDVELTEDGTYTLGMESNTLYARYTLDGEEKRWRGSQADLATLPREATDLSVSEAVRRMQVFVTKGAPSNVNQTLVGDGIEMQPITHPNDLFVGEAAQFKFMLDGKQATGLTVTLIRDGIRYRDQVNEQVYTTNNDGEVNLNFTQPGMYWLEVETEQKSTKKDIDERFLSYSATLEVLPL